MNGWIDRQMDRWIELTDRCIEKRMDEERVDGLTGGRVWIDG